MRSVASAEKKIKQKRKSTGRCHFPMARPRAICFTLNNPSELEVTKVKDGIANNCKYGVFQPEQGANGTRHLQGYAVCDKPTTFKKWKEIVGTRAHIEVARGTAQENKTYCTKEDTRIGEPYEYGSIPEPGRRSDLAGAIAAARDVTQPMVSVFEADPETYLKYYKGLHSIRAISYGKRSWKTEIFWYYGSTGTGKSRRANEEAPDAYWKQGGTKWWCGYDGHEDVIIDDYRRDLCTFSELLRLFDRYPLTVEFKGGNIPFIAKRIFVTTPKSPSETWEGRNDEEIEQLLRRIEHVVCFKKLQGCESPDLS